MDKTAWKIPGWPVRLRGDARGWATRPPPPPTPVPGPHPRMTTCPGEKSACSGLAIRSTKERTPPLARRLPATREMDHPRSCPILHSHLLFYLGFIDRVKSRAWRRRANFSVPSRPVPAPSGPLGPWGQRALTVTVWTLVAAYAVPAGCCQERFAALPGRIAKVVLEASPARRRRGAPVRRLLWTERRPL